MLHSKEIAVVKDTEKNSGNSTVSGKELPGNTATVRAKDSNKETVEKFTKLEHLMNTLLAEKEEENEKGSEAKRCKCPTNQRTTHKRCNCS